MRTQQDGTRGEGSIGAGRSASGAAGHRARGDGDGRRAGAGLAGLALAGLLAGCTDPVLVGGGFPPLTSGPGGGDYVGEVNEGDLVAELEVETPDVPNFTLRATVPLPRGFWTDLDGPVPFRVIDEDLVAYPTQVEVVSRYPAAATDGADVVEVLAQVEAPPGTAPGTRLRYRVLWEPHVGGTLEVPGTVTSLLGTAGALQLRTRDALGHAYTADLFADARAGSGDVRVLRDGEIARQRRTHDVLLPMTPVAGGNGTLPHMMGVHAYVTEWSFEEVISLDLRVHNGLCGLDQASAADDPLAKLYFDDLELRVPAGWTVLCAFDNPYLGAEYDEGAYRVRPIVAPMAGDKLHVMPQQAQMVRRLVVCRQGQETRARAILEEQGIGFCLPGNGPGGNPWFSWFTEGTGRYFPQAHTIPRLDHLNLTSLRNSLSGQLAARSQQVATGSTGSWPVESGGLGWAHPWLVAFGGMHGGTEIQMHDGLETVAARSRDGYRFSQLVHRMYNDRQPSALYRLDGDPTGVQDWTVNGVNGPFVPVYMHGQPMLWVSDPFGFGSSPTFQNDAVAAQGRQPGYEGALLGYEEIDLYHLVRYLRAPLVLAWLGNDAVSKDDLWMQAEIFRFNYHGLPNSQWDDMQVTGLAWAREWIAQHPGRGFTVGRGQGWGLQTTNARYAFADDAWRAAARPWLDEIVDVWDAGQMDCTGILQNEPWPHLFDAQYRCRQQIEESILHTALYGLVERVYRNEDPARTQQVERILRDSAYAMVSAPVWSTQHHGPYALMAVAANNESAMPYCTGFPAGGGYDYANTSLLWSSLAYGWRVSGDQIFLARAVESLTGGGAGDLQTLLEDEGTENLSNTGTLLGLMQTLP